MKLFRFHYSPYARKVQLLLELMGRRFETVECSYGDRRELAALTNGYIHVPVLQTDDGKAIYDSRKICEYLCSQPDGVRFVPPADGAGIWAFHDWCDGALEDVLFRIASPLVRDRREDPWERALYVVIKERKFGVGCVDAWAAQKDELMARAQQLMAPIVRTLAERPFLFGTEPTLADAALYGLLQMVGVEPSLIGKLDGAFPDFMARVEAKRPG
jgi:glutathione S-transferase